MSLASNRNLLLLVVVLAGFATFATFGMWWSERDNTGRIVELEQRLEVMAKEKVPSVAATTARVRTELAALERRLSETSTRLDELAALPRELQSQSTRADTHHATLQALQRELVTLRMRCQKLTDGFGTLETDARLIATAVTELAKRTQVLELRPPPTRDEKPAGLVPTKKGGGG